MINDETEPDEVNTPKVDTEVAYREFVRTMNRLLEEGYSPFPILVGLSRCACEAAQTLQEELHQ